MKIVFFGTGAFGLPALEALSKKYPLSAVVTAADKPSGRNLESKPSVIKKWALEHSIQTIQTRPPPFGPCRQQHFGIRL